jgi:2-polyprenyl-3-methyl-5-hydroxy-6-metoxy-1,4-benzoquinol methylase
MQLQYFGEEFAERRGALFCLYEAINVRRTLRSLRIDGSKRVLEIGPGSGRIMGGLARLGHKAEGLDLSPAVARHIKQRWGLTVHVEPLERHEEKNGAECYDVIIMRHVLEHFPHPEEALATIHSLLKPKGLLYVAVPNMGSWHSRFNGWSGYQPYHIHYFNRRSLKWALTKTKFHVAQLHTYESLTGWPNTIVHSLSARTAGYVGASSTHASGTRRHFLELARLAAGIGLSPLRLFQSLLGQGEELSAVAEKVA